MCSARRKRWRDVGFWGDHPFRGFGGLVGIPCEVGQQDCSDDAAESTSECRAHADNERGESDDDDEQGRGFDFKIHHRKPESRTGDK